MDNTNNFQNLDSSIQEHSFLITYMLDRSSEKNHNWSLHQKGVIDK